MHLTQIIHYLEKYYPSSKLIENNYISGIHGVLNSIFISLIAKDLNKNVFVISPSVDLALRIKDELSLFINTKEIVYLDYEDVSSRIYAIFKLLNKKDRNVFLGTLDSFKKKTFSSDTFQKLKIDLKINNNFPLSELIDKLVSLNYSRVYTVESEGEFAVRGGIVDFFSSGFLPIRVEFDDEKIISLRTFDIYSQRTVSEVSQATILPAFEKEEIDFLKLDKDAVLLVQGLEQDLLTDFSFSKENVIFLTEFPQNKNKEITIPTKIAENYYGNVEKFLDIVSKKNSKVFIVSKQSSRLQELLPRFSRNINILHGELSEGFVIEDVLDLYTDKEIFGEIIPKRRFFVEKVKFKTDEPLPFKEGDYVVHVNHGIGIFKGIKRQSVGNVFNDYLHIQYAGKDVLYVPVDKMNLITRYSAPTDNPPKVNRLGGSEWLNTKKRVKKAIKNMAKELLKIYSERLKVEGIAYPPDSLWQKEFEEAFPYEETEDQIKAINDVKKDMQSSRPMDRLLCGDVGFGKTEVALRAAFKAVDYGKQVCLLVPTTILAEQHYLLFKERFSPYPFKVEMLSRFRSKIEQKRIIEELKTGVIDIVIGTHRLLQDDVSFKNLGLLIIDEEQRFGVMHKEKIKQLKTNIDVLSMSATPIPRTMYMALSGIWDMSIIETPPVGRSKIQTFVLPWNKKIVYEAIKKEIERGGQVFYVHNYIESIDDVVKELRNICPFAKIVGAHGRMHEKTLEKIMLDFSANKFDVLVSTTIIESGLDMPNVNTIIIEDPQRMGLSTLYQLRGRVGRSNIKAYAYFLYKSSSVFTEKALERLSAIKSFTDLGSGQKIAMKDLEIRGAGNILGVEQHGHMIMVGFDLYCEMLKEAVSEVKGEKPLIEKTPEISLNIEAYLPEDYIQNELERISFYKRLNYVDNQNSLNEIKEEILDRFGALPIEAKNLFDIVKLRIEAKKKGIESIFVKGENIIFIKTNKERKIIRISKLLPHQILKKVMENI